MYTYRFSLLQNIIVIAIYEVFSLYYSLTIKSFLQNNTKTYSKPLCLLSLNNV